MMYRLFVPLALLAIVALLTAGCGGGGGTGGDSSPGMTTLSGRVIGTGGSALSGAEVTITADGRSPISATTNGEGTYTMNNVPTNTNFTLTVTASGMSARTWTGMRINTTDMPINTTDMPSGAKMHIAFASETLPAGSVLNITPNIANIALNDTPYFFTRVTDSVGTTISSNYPVVWTVVGNIPSELPAGNMNMGRYLYLLGQQAGARARVTSTALIGTTPISRTLEITVQDTSSDPVEPPPPPPPPG